MYELRDAVGNFFKMTTIINFLSLMIVHSDHEAEEQQLFISHVWRILVQLRFDATKDLWVVDIDCLSGHCFHYLSHHWRNVHCSAHLTHSRIQEICFFNPGVPVRLHKSFKCQVTRLLVSDPIYMQ
jgi:hypothetical protein